MQKFTIFTFLLALVVIISVSEVAVTEYLPNFKKNPAAEDLTLELPTGLDTSEAMQTSVLGSDLSGMEVQELDLGAEEAFSSGLEEFGEAAFEEVAPAGTMDFENTMGDFSAMSTVGSGSVLIREDQIKSAGFVNAALTQEPHDGMLFKTISVEDLYDVTMTKNAIKSPDELLAKVYVFTVGPASSAESVYEVLKVRGAQGLDVEINETNDFGDGSFYINDARRSGTAFLTVKIGDHIYGFSYPKTYHNQIKNLVTLLDLEF